MEKTSLLTRTLGCEEDGEKYSNEIVNLAEALSGHDYDDLLSQYNEWTQLSKEQHSIEVSLRDQKRLVQNFEKMAALLHDHEYDPNCKYCSDNKFVKDAEKATKELPDNQKILCELEKSLENMIKRCEGYNQVHTDIQEYKDISHKKTKLEEKIEKNKLVVSHNRAKIDLLSNEIETLESKAEEYELNKEAIENKELLHRQRSALVEKIKQNKAAFLKCDELTKEYLVEEATTKQIIRSLISEKSEFNDVLNEYRAYDVYMTCMHPNGISYEIIQQKLPVINDEIAKILSSIVEFEVFF